MRESFNRLADVEEDISVLCPVCHQPYARGHFCTKLIKTDFNLIERKGNYHATNFKA